MKILHTSDWHLGHTLYNYDRSHEQQAFFATTNPHRSRRNAGCNGSERRHLSLLHPIGSHTKDVHGWYARNSQGMSRNDDCGNCRKPRQQF